MKWLLIIWLTQSPLATGVIEQVDEQSCLDTLEYWVDLSPDHRGVCVYGNLTQEEMENLRVEED